MAVIRQNVPGTRRLGGGFPLTLTATRLRTIIYVVSGMLALTAIYLVMSFVFSNAQVMLDDMQYGRPRSFHLTADVGHAGGTPSHLVAMNLDGQVVIFDMPGGDYTQTRVLQGPYLVGSGEELTPVQMHLHDHNGDGHSDLIVQVKNEEIVYLNQDGQFQHPTVGMQ